MTPEQEPTRPTRGQIAGEIKKWLYDYAYVTKHEGVVTFESGADAIDALFTPWTVAQAQRIAALEAALQQKELDVAEAMALVLSHEGHIATLEARLAEATRDLGEARTQRDHWRRLIDDEYEHRSVVAARDATIADLTRQLGEVRDANAKLEYDNQQIVDLTGMRDHLETENRVLATIVERMRAVVEAARAVSDECGEEYTMAPAVGTVERLRDRLADFDGSDALRDAPPGPSADIGQALKDATERVRPFVEREERGERWPVDRSHLIAKAIETDDPPSGATGAPPGPGGGA